MLARPRRHFLLSKLSQQLPQGFGWYASAGFWAEELEFTFKNWLAQLEYMENMFTRREGYDSKVIV